MTTTKLQMPELVVGQAGKELTHNQALAVLDQLAQAVVVDKDLTAPPGSPANGSMYIVAAGATGAWAGQSGKLAYWLTTVAAWTFITPADGWSVWVTDEAVRYERKDGAWVEQTGGVSGMANPMTTAGDLIVGGSAGVPNRLGLGSSAQVLRVNLAGTGLEYATPASGGGLTNLTETKTTAAPNTVVPVVSLSATISETNGDFAIAPKGSGALLAQIPDSSVANGQKRGAYSVDWQRSRSVSDQVAYGGYSVVGGGNGNKASGDYSTLCGGSSNLANATYSSVLGGQSNTASAQHASVLGGFSNTASGQLSMACGDGNTASGVASVALGKNCLAGGYYSTAIGSKADTRGVQGALAHAGGGFYGSPAGSGQHMGYILLAQTTNATATRATTDQNNGLSIDKTQVRCPLKTLVKFRIQLSAIANTSYDVAAWEIQGTLKCGASVGTTAMVGTPTITQTAVDAGASAWGVAVTADSANGSLNLTVTGAASTTIRWVATVDTSEVSFA